jgi:hypothetical protein
MKTFKAWAGLLSIVWMLSGFVVIHYVVVPERIVVGPIWLWPFVLLGIQLGPGLLLAIAGMRSGSRAGKVTAILAACLFCWFVWYGVVPALAVLLPIGSK